MANANDDSINELITRYLTGEASPDEQTRLLAWIDQSPENKRYFDAYEKAFELTEAHFKLPEASDVDIDIDKEWDHFTETAKLQKPVRQLSPVRMWLRAAAAVLLIAATAGILYYYSLDKLTVYQTAESTQTLNLPDGSQVTLNRFTTLTYEPDFGGVTRTINLKGEAFFDVTPNAAKPFIILTEKAKIQVLGTSFTVSAYDSLSTVEVIVATGVVSLGYNRDDHVIRLEAGTKGVLSKTQRFLASAGNKDVNFLSWRTKRIVFADADLRSVVETLRRTYGTDITINTNIPDSCSVTVTFEGQSLESVLKVLENTLNLKYTIRNNKVDITEAGC